MKSNLIITAAHCCIVATAPSHFIVKAGSNQRSSQNQTRKVVQSFMHPGFDSVTLHNDICLLILEEPFENLDAIDVGNNTQSCWVVGWGKTEDSLNTVDDLRKVLIDIVPAENCSKVFQVPFDEDTMICAGNKVRILFVRKLSHFSLGYFPGERFL